MRRIINMIARPASVLLFVFLCLESASPRALTAFANTISASKDSSVLRLHVVANSDSEQDQRVKLLVRDALLERFAPADNLSQAEELLLSDGAGVLETVESVLREQGASYGAQLRFGVMEFPDKSYGDITYPAGEYEALKVELGSASGQNWWCVLFPPICLLDIGAEEIEGSEEIVFESDLALWVRGIIEE